jgi:hypothetical protein
MRIELNGQSIVRPFAWLGDFAPSPPLIASWMPANAVVARINGRDCYTVAEVARQCVELMRTPAAADIEVPAESLLAGAGNQEGQLNDLIAWWFTELRTRLGEARTGAGTLAQRRVGAVTKATQQRVGLVQPAMQQRIGAVLAATEQRLGAAQQKLGSQQAEIGVMRQNAETQSSASVLISTLKIICTVVGVVLTVFTVGAASLAIIAVMIVLVVAVGTTGVVSATPIVRIVVLIARQVGGLSLNLAVDATVTIVSIVVLTVLVFMLAGRQGFEWAWTRVLGGRRGWKFRLS